MRMKSWLPVLLLLVLLASCKGGKAASVRTPTPDPGFTQADLVWLKAHAVPFDTTDPTAALDDLAPLKSMVGEARIVALGDATYGTHEFFQMKHRILEYLVENMGFTALLMPVDYLVAEKSDAYIHTGEGNITELLKGFYTIWDTQEILDMVEWMRAYNADPAHPRKVSLYGFGIPSEQSARAAVIGFIQKVDPPTAVQVQDDYSCVQSGDACMKRLQDVVDLLNAHRQDYSAASSQAEFEKALHSARTVIQDVLLSSDSNNFSLFDQYINDNVKWDLDRAGPQGKVVLWAHNMDVRKSVDAASQSLGAFLNQQYPDQLVTFGMLFYHGSFNAVRYGSQNIMQVFHAPEPGGDSYEFFLQAAGLPGFFLDMRPAKPTAPDQAWLFNPHSTYMVGQVYDRNNPFNYTEPLAKMFDVILYLKDTTPSILLNQ